MRKKTVPPKNYAILLGVIVLIICACFASYNLYKVHQEYKISSSPLANREIMYEDLKNATKEIDADTFLLISYVRDTKVYKNEKVIKKYLTKKNLIDNVMYLNVTDYKNDSNFIKELNSVLKLNNNLEIKKFPAVIFYNEGVATISIDSSKRMLNQDDFKQIIDMYELAS